MCERWAPRAHRIEERLARDVELAVAASKPSPIPLTLDHVLGLEDESPGGKAGLLVGDVITTWDGDAVSSVGNIAQRLVGSAVGSRVNLGVSRGGHAHNVEVTLGERPRG